jgi:hypothetical protein
MARKRNNFAPSEDDITAAVVDHWKLLGVPGSLVASIPNKRAFGQAGLKRGLADLLVFAPGLTVGFVELKRDYDSPISDDQRDFGSLCARLGIPYAICIGRDEPINLLEQWNVVRAQGARNSSPKHGEVSHGWAGPGVAWPRKAKQGKDIAA